MTSLMEFLTARLAETETDAVKAGGDRWTLDGGIYRGHPTDEVVDWVYGEADEHIARNDPAYVLADIAAKRRIMELYERTYESRLAHPDDLASAGALLALLGVVKLLACVYSDHPDYRQEWTP